MNLYESAPPKQHSVDFDMLLNEDIPVQHQDTSTACIIVIAQSTYVVVFRIQLFRERLSEEMRTRQSRNVIWDMINTLFVTTEAVEPTFVAFL